MGSRHWLLAAVAALFLTLPGCDGPADQSAPSSDTATSADPAVALVGAPDDGTCWTVPADAAVDPNYWFDDSHTVPCTEPHTTETTTVMLLSDPTVAEAKELASACWNNVRVHLGVNARFWVPWGFAMFLPSREQIGNGASWVRCDAVFPESWDFGSVRSTTISSAGVAIDPPADLWACLDEDPMKTNQPFVPCGRPHQYEQTGRLAILDGLAQYPSSAELDAEARQQCSLGVQGGDGDNLAVTATWDPRSALREGASIAGACFMFNKTGHPLAPRE